MAVSKSASLLRQMSLQRWDVQQLEISVSLSSSALCIVHCVGVFSCRPFFQRSNVLPRGEALSFVSIQCDPLSGGDLRSAHKCLLCRIYQNPPWRNSWDASYRGETHIHYFSVLCGKTSSCASSVPP